MDGLELVKRLRSISTYREVPVIMHSSESGENWIRAAMEAGVSQWLEKSSASEMAGVVWKFIGYPGGHEEINEGNHSSCCLAGWPVNA
jgi:DNA-binding NtrC family response regulator